MRKFNLSSNLEYEISLGDNIQEELQSFIDINYSYQKKVFITDEIVDFLYPEFTFLSKKDSYRYVIKPGEPSKSIETYY